MFKPFDGLFYNPAYAGEGFNIRQLEDGAVFGHWNTFDLEGKPTWFVLSGKISEDGLSCTCSVSTVGGGIFTSPANGDMVYEYGVGELTFYLNEYSNIDEFTFEGVNGLEGGYSLEYIPGTEPPDVLPQPGYPAPKELPGEAFEKLGVTVKKNDMPWVERSPWITHREVPVTGRSPLRWSRMRTGRAMKSFIITDPSGNLEITDVTVSGDHSPWAVTTPHGDGVTEVSIMFAKGQQPVGSPDTANLTVETNYGVLIDNDFNILP